MVPCLLKSLDCPQCLARNWPVSGCSGNVRTKHLRLCCAEAPWSLLSSGRHFINNWSFCPWGSSLKSSLKSKEQWPDGQMHCPGRPAAKTNSAQPCQGLPFSPGELWWERGSQPRLSSHKELRSFLPSRTSGFLNPWKAERFFQPQRSTCQCTRGRNINAHPYPSVGQTGLGTKWKDVLENT